MYNKIFHAKCLNRPDSAYQHLFCYKKALSNITCIHCFAVQHVAVIWHCSDELHYVIPRHKKPTLPCGDLASYRPISNLPFLSKLLEWVVSMQFTEYLSSAGLLSVHQAAYRKFHSTETALLKVETKLIEAIDAGDHALLDISAAFDTVDHDVLV